MSRPPRVQRALGALVVAVSCAIAGGCTAATAARPTDPLGWWRLSSASAGVVVDEAGGAVYLRVIDSKLETVTPCGVYTATLKATEDGTRTVSSASGDPVGCEPRTMTFDRAYLVALHNLASVGTSSGELVIAVPGGELRYQRLRTLEPVKPGPRWQLQAISFSGQLRGANKQPAAPLQWRDGEIVGTTGCRAFQLRYVERDSAQAEELENLGVDVKALTVPTAMAKEPVCTDPLQRRQDSWLRSVLRDDIVVFGDDSMLAITHATTTAIYFATDAH